MSGRLRPAHSRAEIVNCYRKPHGCTICENKASKNKATEIQSCGTYEGYNSDDLPACPPDVVAYVPHDIMNGYRNPHTVAELKRKASDAERRYCARWLKFCQQELIEAAKLAVTSSAASTYLLDNEQVKTFPRDHRAKSKSTERKAVVRTGS